jgi:hypothetical protein
MTGTPQMPAALRDLIIAEAKRDYLGLWWVVRKVREQVPGLSVSERRAATLEFLGPLLQSGELMAGELSKDGRTFSAWDGDGPEVLSRIDATWPLMVEDPDIGDIVWLTSPA